MSNASIVVTASNGAFIRNSLVGDTLFYTQSNRQSIHIGVNSNACAGIVLSSNVNRIVGSNLSVCNDYVVGSNLIAYYPFDTNAKDAVGTYHLTTIGAPSFQPGMFNNAAFFPNPSNGAGYENSWFENTAIGSAITGPPCTFACWFNMSAAPSGGYQPVIFALGSNFASPSIMANVNAGGTALIVTINTTGVPTYPVNNYVVSGNTWYHLAVTYNNSNVVTYVNGSQINSTANTGNFSISAANSRLRIGAMGNTTGNNAGFNGLIDDFRVYNRALSATEVSTLYAARPSVSLSVTGSNAGLSNYVGVLTPNAQQALEVGGNIVCTGNVSAGNLGMFRNRIINGDFRVDQRNTYAASNFNQNINAYCSDRWKAVIGSAGAVWTIQTMSTLPAPLPGFGSCLKITNTTLTSFAATDIGYLYQYVEGYNVADLGWGTKAAVPVSVSFWVYTSAPGTYTLNIFNNAGTRSYRTNFVVALANQWQYVQATIPGDTSGSWPVDSSASFCCMIVLLAGSSQQGATGSWGAYTQGGTGHTNAFSTQGNTFHITGVQLEKGTVATPFEFRPLATEQRLCQRYCKRWNDNNTFQIVGHGNMISTTMARIQIPLSEPMRAKPTCTVSTTTGACYVEYWNGSTNAPVNINGGTYPAGNVIYTAGDPAIGFYPGTASAITAGAAVGMVKSNGASATYYFEANADF